MSDEQKRERKTNLKRYIAETSAAIRRKYRLLRRGRADEETELIRTLDPIVKPLETLVETSKENISSGKKRDRSTQTEITDTTHPTISTPSTPLPPVVQSVKLDTVAETSATPSERLKEETTTPEGRKALKSYLSEVGAKSSPYIQSVLYGDKEGLDQTYGIRFNGHEWVIGNSPVQIADDVVNVCDIGYLTTSGLLELLFMKRPDLESVTDEDWTNYKEILINTNAHRQNYSANKQINSNRGEKYVNVISRLFPTRATLWTTSSPLTRVRPDTIRRVRIERGGGKKIGYGMSSIGVGETVVRYWNNPNELVDRLRLLIASKKAGNTSHDGETWALIDELRESGIIE